MNSRAFYGRSACVLLALTVMPAAASARQGAAAIRSTAPRVEIIAAENGYVIASKDETPPVAMHVAQPVRIGGSIRIDRLAFDRFAHAPVSAGQ